MIPTSSDWKEYAKYNHVFHVRGTLVNGVTLTLDDSDFMINTIKVTDAVSSSSTFDIGAVISNTFECTLNNFDGKFEGFDFDGATLTIEFGIIYADETEEWIQRGIYRVDKPESLGSTIQIKAFDNMDKLNRYFAGFQPTFPISAKNLVRGMCDYCGVGYSSMWNAANPTINAFDYNESTTCRQVLNWVCQIIGCYARVARNGNLTVKWYSPTWEVGDVLDGGTINPWESVDEINGGTMNPWAVVADIDGGEYGEVDWTASQVKSLTVGIDRITITGVRAYAYNTVDQFQFAEAGNSGYIIKLENNPLINEDNMAEIANRVNDVVGNMRIQPFKGTIYGDPSMVAGDSIVFQDYRGRQYTSFITNLTYSISGTCEVSLGAETPNEKDLEFSNPTTGVIQGATRAAYDYISARKIDGSIINAGTLNAGVFDTATRNEVDTANGQITTISGGGISVHENGDTSNEVTIKSDGVRVFASNSEVAKFGRNSDGIGELRFKDGLLLTDLTSTYQSYASGLFGTLYSAMLGFMDSNNDVTAKVQVDDEYISLDAGDGVASSLLTKSATVLFRVDSIDSLIVTSRDPQTPFTHKVYNNGNLIPSGDILSENKSVPSGGSGTELHYVTLPKGVWTIKVQVQFAQDGNGRRAIWLTETSGGGVSGAICVADNAALSSASTYLELTLPIKTTTQKTYHVVGYQNSGSALIVDTQIFYSGFETK